MMNQLFTIGHSNHTIERLLELLKMHDIEVVCDVRSVPYSSYTPQFNREAIQQRLKKESILYVFLGKELGPRSDDTECYEQGKIKYERIAKTALFHQGLKRLTNGLESYRVAVMCSEKDPVTCHRMILVCRHLRSIGINIKHILENGNLETHHDAERRLMKDLKIPEQTLFEKPEELLERAYDTQGERIAYELREDEKKY